MIASLNAAGNAAQRFSLAHEIGHLVMHTGVATAEMEAEANQFAAELLMPAETIRKQLRLVQLRDLGQLKAIWHVSLAALIYRAREIGEITDRHARTLFMGLFAVEGERVRVVAG